MRLLLFVLIPIGNAKITIVPSDELWLAILVKDGVGKENLAARDILFFSVFLAWFRHECLN